MPVSRSDHSSSQVRKTRLLRWFAIIGIALLLLIMLSQLALPALLRSYGSDVMTEKLNRKTTIGTVAIDPFSLTLRIGDLTVLEPDGGDVFASMEALALDFSWQSIRQLAPVIQEVRLTKPYLHLARNAAYQYNFDDILDNEPEKPASGEPARFSVNNIQIEGGKIAFDDAPEKTSHAVSELTLNIPFISSMPADVQVFVEPMLSAMVNGSPLQIKGKARPFARDTDGTVEFELDNLDLTRYFAYLPAEPGWRMASGKLDARLSLSFEQPAEKAPVLALRGSAALKSIRIVAPDGSPLVQLPELQLSLKQADLSQRRIDLGVATVKGLNVDLRRGADGLLEFQRLMPAPAVKAAEPRKAATNAPWRVSLAELRMQDASVRYTDAGTAAPWRAAVEHADITARAMALDTGKKTVRVSDLGSSKATVSTFFGKRTAPKPAAAQASAPSAETGTPYAVLIDKLHVGNWTAEVRDETQNEPITVRLAQFSFAAQPVSTAPGTTTRTSLSTRVNENGQVTLDGTLGMAPFQADLTAHLERVDVLPLQPLIADKMNLRLTKAEFSTKGKLTLAQDKDGTFKGGYSGNAGLTNLAAQDKASGRQFLRWKSLDAGGIDMRIKPFSLAIDRVGLSDFFARVAIDANGRLNVQNIVPGKASGTTNVEKRPEAARETPHDAPPEARIASAPPSSQAPDGKNAPGKMPPVAIREMKFENGQVRFTDNFIKPNYTARLMELAGTVKGLSSDPASPANVDLQGEVSGAPLSIAGRIHPLRKDMLLDLKASVRGMELVTLSPYASKYVGYGIEKGKLSFEVAYLVEEGRISATNRLILNQLTLSDQPSDSAVKQLPVKLALALLQDRNGVIDVNVPIQGSLNDPEFSVGGIVLKVIGNAIVKAVSQPFAAIGALFGNGSDGEKSFMPFEPGQAVIARDGETKLGALAKALAERPALKLEIQGWADPAADVPGLKRAEVERKVRALKRRDLQARGEDTGAGITVTPEEYPGLLTRVFKEEKFEKPLNPLGLPKNLPLREMENLIQAHTAIDREALLSLANRRAQSARDWLVKSGKIADERLFILAPENDLPDEEVQRNPGSLSKVQFALR